MPMEPQIVRPPQPSVSLKFLFIIILVLLLGLAVVGYQLYKNQLPSFLSLATPTPVASTDTGPIISSLDSCDIKKEGNPLVGFLNYDEKNKILAGTFEGNIISAADLKNGLFAIGLISANGQQSHYFQLKPEAGLVKSVVENKEIELKDLKVGMGVTMSFNCITGRDTRSRIVNIQVTKIR